MSGGKAPRPKGSPSATLSPQAKLRSREPGSPLSFWREVANKYRAGVSCLPKNVFNAVAAILNACGRLGAERVVVEIAATKRDLGHYGLWHVRLLEDGDGRELQAEHVERVKSWYGEVEVGFSHRKTGPAEYEFTAKVKLTCGPDRLWRAMFFASRALFLAAIRLAQKPGVI